MTPASMPLNIEFDAIIAREKNSGWSCAILPGSGIAFGTRKPVKVAGTVDDVAFDATMLPIGDGTHMVPLEAALRKAIGKQEGDSVTIRLHQRHS